jgi:hypothetical protein
VAILWLEIGDVDGLQETAGLMRRIKGLLLYLNVYLRLDGRRDAQGQESRWCLAMCRECLNILVFNASTCSVVAFIPYPSDHLHGFNELGLFVKGEGEYTAQRNDVA